MLNRSRRHFRDYKTRLASSWLKYVWSLSLLFLIGCGGSSSTENDSSAPAPSPAPGQGIVLNAIQLTAENANNQVGVGFSTQLTATGNFSTGSTEDLTTLVSWTVTQTANYLTLDENTGEVTGQSAGTVEITASLDGIDSNTLTMTVTNPILESIQITPANTSIANGLSQQYVATGYYDDSSTQDLSDTVTWSSSNAGVATLNASGLATTLSTGTTNISADYDSIISNTATLTVTAALLESIAITPSTPSVAKGLTQQFTSMGTYTDGSDIDITNTVTWNSTDTGVATINSTGLATGLSAGSSDVYASLSGITSTSETLTITSAELVSIAITPGAASIPQASAQQFTATGSYTDASTSDLTNVASWQSSNLSTATISSSGLANSLVAGSTSVTAEYNSVTSPAVILTVTSASLLSIAVTPDQPSINDLQSQVFTATGTYDDASMVDITDIVTWASDDTGTATISASGGTADAVAYGTAQITATLDAINGSTDLQVTLSSIPVCGGLNDTDPTNGQGACLKLIEGGADGPTNGAARVPPVVTTGEANEKLFTGNPSISLAEALGYTLDDTADNTGRTYARAQGATGGGTWVMFRQDGDGWQSDNGISNPPYGDEGQFDRYCKVLTELAFYGRTNWRRPTENELIDLYYDKDLNSVDNTIYDAFGWAHPRTYWTSTGGFKRVNLVNGSSDTTFANQSRAASCVSENP